MNRRSRCLRLLWLVGLLSTCSLAILWGELIYEGAVPAKAMPLAQSASTPTPTLMMAPEQTCPWPGTCAVARYYSYQPARYSLRSNFNDAARNSLSGAPVYPTINDGIPPNVTPQAISSNRPFPNVLLRAVAGQESKWKQFADDEWTDPDEQSFCTLVSPDCGYGIMQQTSNS